MPATQTITAFYSFNPSTTIRSSEVNNNFDFIRGNIYPIDASATAFANNTYDLGSTSASWRNTYTRDLILGASGTISLNSTSITTFTLPTTSGRLALENEVTAKFTTALARTINNTTPTIIYEVEVWDTANAYNPATGEFTCPSAGKYNITGGFATAGTTTSIGHANILRVFKNGTIDCDLAASVAQTTSAVVHRGYGAADVSCAQNDILTFRFYADTANTLNSGAGSVSNHVTVKKTNN